MGARDAGRIHSRHSQLLRLTNHHFYRSNSKGSERRPLRITTIRFAPGCKFRVAGLPFAVRVPTAGENAGALPATAPPISRCAAPVKLLPVTVKLRWLKLAAEM